MTDRSGRKGDGAAKGPPPSQSIPPPSVPSVPPPAAASVPPPKSDKKKITKAKKSEMGNWSFFAKHQPGDSVRFVLAGDSIGATSGDARAIGNAISRMARLLDSLGGAGVQLESIQFGASVTVELRAPTLEVERAESELVRARELDAKVEEPSTSAANDGDGAAEIDAALAAATTTVQVAAALAWDLLAVPSQDAAAAAVERGTQVAQAYRTLANEIADKRLTLRLENPATESDVELTDAKALRVSEALRTVTSPTTNTVTVYGVLSVADAIHGGFGLRLDKDARRPPALKGKQIIRGSYRPIAGKAIKDEGLWGQDVKARVQIVRDPLVSNSSIRPAQYTLLSVKARYE